MALVTGALASYLEAHREELNDRVADAHREAPDFDPQTFATALTDLVAPVVEAVERRGDGFAGQVAGSLVNVALGLCADRRLDGAIRDGWTDLLPVLPVQLSAAPHRVVASVSNALATLERAPGARPAEWIARMTELAACCPDVDALLAAGQVAAWRAGMAAYREPALELAGDLEPAALTAALGAVDLAALRADPWSGADVALPVRVGAFRGFGGPFPRPPVVRGLGGQVLATDGDEVWQVFADAFGTAVVRVPGRAAAELPPLPPDAPPAPVAGIAELTSWTASTAGLVATTATSHAVLFLGVDA